MGMSDGSFELRNADRGVSNGPSYGQEESFKEFGLLLPNWQLLELERMASQLGLTTGKLLRRVIWIYLTRLD